MKTTSLIQNPAKTHPAQGACIAGHLSDMAASKANGGGSTIICTEKTDCRINPERDGKTDNFISLGQHLKEHRRMRYSLRLAQEVQQSLLPSRTPQMKSLDIAGKSIYCDETGGDYFDYHDLSKGHHEKLGVTIGDVSGHGVSAALLMATVRAALRQRVSQPGSLTDIISDVNRQLVSDVQESGQFIGLLYLVADMQTRSIRWVRAGHTPALLYDPEEDTFEELNGPGVALGVDAGFKFAENQKRDLKRGQVILMATDGIWEARNPAGKMLGKSSIENIVRQNKGAGAEQILNAVFNGLQQFRRKTELEDDITVVVIKIAY